ncbi:MAG: ATP synthase subunit I [Gammaproteobacteria bacterium]|nr:ATP synthase subunit I [Gammaproteobacteria bacterium]
MRAPRAPSPSRTSVAVPEPYRIVGLQVIVVAAVALPMWLVGTAQARSAVLGGLTVVLPNAYFALGTVRRAIPDGDAERLTEARRLLGRGIGKWALTALLLVAVFRFVPVEPLGFFGALTAALLAQAVAPLITARM